MSGGTQLDNANPVLFEKSGARQLTASEEDEDVHDPIDDREIFDILVHFLNWHNFPDLTTKYDYCAS